MPDEANGLWPGKPPDGRRAGANQGKTVAHTIQNGAQVKKLLGYVLPRRGRNALAVDGGSKSAGA